MRRACIAVLLAGMVNATIQAAEPKPAPPAEDKVEPVDMEFLEFLGSLDAEGEDWREFLESRPMRVEGKVAEKKQPPAKPDPKKKEQVKKP